MNDFNEVFTRTISPTHEGSEYINDPHDPGGESKYGISKKAYPKLDIKNLTEDGARQVYLTDYWNKLPDIPFSIRYQVFDFAINSGISTSIRHLQRVLNVSIDGSAGQNTLHMINITPLHKLVMSFIADRIYFMTRLYEWQYESKGWMNRMAMNLEYGAIDLDGLKLS